MSFSNDEARDHGKTMTDGVPIVLRKTSGPTKSVPGLLRATAQVSGIEQVAMSVAGQGLTMEKDSCWCQRGHRTVGQICRNQKAQSFQDFLLAS